MAKGDLESLKDGAAQNHATERGAKQSLIAALGLLLGAEVGAPVDASEYGVPNPGPTSGGAYQVFSSAYNDQQHFAYVDANNNIQDVWWDGVDNQWNVQQLTGSSTSENVVGSPGPPAASA